MAHGVPADAVARTRSVRSRPRPRGRDVELAAVRELLDRLRDGTGGVVLVTGGPGSGKSLILREAVAMAEEDQVRVGTASAHPGDQVVELSPLLQALFDGTHPLVPEDVRPSLRASSEQRYWVLQDLRHLLEQLAGEGPVLICLDDLQWADPGTFAALRSLPGLLSGVAVGWLLCSRTPRHWPEVDRVLQGLVEAGARRLDLQPLDPSAVARVAQDRLVAAPTDALLELLHAAGGDPFVLTELLAGLQEEHAIRLEEGRAVLTADGLPARLTDGMRSRLGRLSPEARQAVTVAASLGSRFTVPALARMLDRTPAGLVEALEEGIAAELLRAEPRSMSFWHDITRDAVRGSIASAARRALDRQGADVLLAEGALPVEVALQLAASADRGDRAAVTILQEAARQISLNDPGSAADLCLQALRLVDQADPVRATLLGETAVWMYAAGRVDEAQLFVDTALRSGITAAQEAEVCFSLAGLLELPPDLLAGYGRRALALPGVPDDLRHRHLVRLLWNLQIAGRYEEAAALVPEARAGAGAADGQATRFTLWLVEAALDQIDGRLGTALVALERALAEGPGPRDDARVHVARMWRLALLPHVDRLDEAFTESDEAIDVARRHRQAFALTIHAMTRGRLLVAQGRPRDAIQALDALLPAEVADRGGVIHAAALVALGRAAQQTGDDGLLDRACAIAERMVRMSTPAVQRLARWLLALRALWAGDPHGAHTWLCVHGTAERLESLEVVQASPSDDVDLARIGRGAHDEELLLHALRVAARRADLNPTVTSLAGFAAHTRGVAFDDVDELRRAVLLLEQGTRPLALASALEDLGAADPDDGSSVPALDRALVLYHEAGADSEVRRVRRRLRDRGVNRRLGSRTRPASGWDALTDAEVAVADLVAAGLTNRQAAERLFVSPHTVGTHLRHVFEKLEISSRVDLARQRGQRGS